MIRLLSVDSRALDEPSDEERRGDAHRRLAGEARRYCALRLLGPADAADLFERVKSADEDVREIWGHLLKDLGTSRIFMVKDNPIPASLRALLEAGGVPDGLEHLVDILLGSSTVSKTWAGDPELTSVEQFDLSRTITIARRLHDEPTYPQGTLREKIWDDQWRRPAQLSNEAWICSPYLFGKDRFNPSDERRLDHVVWLLDRLHAAMPAKGAMVHLYAAKWAYALEDVAAVLRRSSFCEERPGSLSIHIAPWRPEVPSGGGEDFHGPHDRHIRFSCNVAFDVPSDFDRLRHDAIREAQGYKCHYLGPGPSLRILQDVELGVLDHAESYTVEGAELVPSPPLSQSG